MKKLVFMIVAMLVLFAANFSYGEIIEKNNQRYFKLGDQEYVCNADNRISDESAENILKRVRKIYNSKSDKKKDKNIVEEVWASLHKVYSGEAYNEILFICLRYKLNKLFAYLQSPSEDATSETGYKYGQLVSFSSPPAKFYHRGTRYYYPGEATSHVDIYVLDCRVKTTYINKKGGATLPVVGEWSNDGLVKMADEQRELELAKFQKTDEYKQKAIDTFCEKIDQLFNYWLSKADSDSYILEYQWDELLVKISQVVLSMGESCGEDVAREVAGKLLETFLRYAQTEDTKKELISFGKKESLEFVVPKTKEVIEKQLF